MKHNSVYRLFVLVLSTIAILLLLGLLPPSFTNKRKIDIVGDVLLDKETLAQRREDSLRAKREKEIADSLAQLHKLKGGQDKYFADFSLGSDNGIQSFYKALDSLRTINRPVRIAYYGDSYIEGDILTSDLRCLFQDKFGGAGAGWVDCGPTTNLSRPTVGQKSNGFETFVAAAPKNFDASRQGISQRYSTLPSGSGTITFRGTKAWKHCGDWNVSEIMFRSPHGGTFTCTTDGGSHTFEAKASGEVQSIRVNDKTESVTWDIKGSGITIFGASNENTSGVTVDNFAMRGCSGLTIGGIPDQTMEEFAQLRSYDLIVLQYGLNVVTPNCSEQWLKHYGANMGKVIQNLKKAYPHTTILVMSVAPRGSRQAGQIVTMKGIDKMTECHMNMAKDNQVVFMNLYEVLGGPDAVSNLSDKGYVGHDLTHISFKGGRYVAKKIYDELMKRY